LLSVDAEYPLLFSPYVNILLNNNEYLKTGRGPCVGFLTEKNVAAADSAVGNSAKEVLWY
jgi:hypothetical protein